MIPELEAEVLVVGGGPAGAACALTLANLRRRVVLCEAARFPREHVGVCLSPGVVHQLGFLGIRHILDDPAHLTDVPVQLSWGLSGFEPAPVPTLIADRGRFDADLLSAGADCGVRVLQPARIDRLARDGSGWQADVIEPSGRRTIRTRYVIDARGRTSRARPRRTWMGPRTLALRGTWSGNTEATMRIGAAASSWSWTAPIAGRRRLAIAFTAPHTLRQMAGSLADGYLRLLEEAGVLGPGLDLEGEPRVCDATPYQIDDDEPGVLRIGDADTALDPLSSSGVQAAIQSALRAGPVVNTMLTPSSDKDAAIEYWNARRSAQAATHRSWSSDRYSEAYQFHSTDFWRVRAAPTPSRIENTLPATPLPSPDQLLALSAAAKLVQTPSLIGAQVVRTTSLSHPNLQEAVAFVDGVPLHAVLAPMSKLSTAAELIAIWRTAFSLEKALAVLGWLWRNGIITARLEAPATAAHRRN